MERSSRDRVGFPLVWPVAVEIEGCSGGVNRARHSATRAELRSSLVWRRMPDRGGPGTDNHSGCRRKDNCEPIRGAESGLPSSDGRLPCRPGDLMIRVLSYTPSFEKIFVCSPVLKSSYFVPLGPETAIMRTPWESQRVVATFALTPFDNAKPPPL